MQVTGFNNKINSNYNSAFRTNGFYNITQELDSSVMLSRAVVEVFGCTIPWIVLANNGTEKKEKTRKFIFENIITYGTPFIALPLTNRINAKYIGKFTKSIWSNNHKAIHISNEFLKDKESMMKELQKMSEKTTRGPVEALFNKLFPSKKYEQKINIEELLKNCNDDKERLRKQLIKSKAGVFISDYALTFGLLGSIPFINNEITKTKTGQSGFSAEMNMANREIVEKRAENYEKNKKKNYFTFLALLGTGVAGISIATFTSLYSKNSNKFTQFLKNNAKLFDYNKGIYMARLPLFLGYVTSYIFGCSLASRNSTEQKDNAIRQGVGISVFFGGDLLLSSLLANISDRMFGTQLCKDRNSSLFKKIFPATKSFEQVVKEIEQGKISKKNKRSAAIIFWTDIVLLIGMLGYLIPKIINKMIKHDVEKDVNAKEGLKYKVN